MRRRRGIVRQRFASSAPAQATSNSAYRGVILGIFRKRVLDVHGPKRGPGCRFSCWCSTIRTHRSTYLTFEARKHIVLSFVLVHDHRPSRAQCVCFLVTGNFRVVDPDTGHERILGGSGRGRIPCVWMGFRVESKNERPYGECFGLVCFPFLPSLVDSLQELTQMASALSRVSLHVFLSIFVL